MNRCGFSEVFASGAWALLCSSTTSWASADASSGLGLSESLFEFSFCFLTGYSTACSPVPSSSWDSSIGRCPNIRFLASLRFASAPPPLKRKAGWRRFTQSLLKLVSSPSILTTLLFSVQSFPLGFRHSQFRFLKKISWASFSWSGYTKARNKAPPIDSACGPLNGLGVWPHKYYSVRRGRCGYPDFLV